MVIREILSELISDSAKTNREAGYSMRSSRDRHKPEAPPGTLIWALMGLRETFKKKYGIDVKINLRIHYWPATDYLAYLATREMKGAATDWEFRQSDLGQIHNEKGVGNTTTYGLTGKGQNEGIDVVIFKTKGQKSPRFKALSKSKSVLIHNDVAGAVLRIRKWVREHYGTDADITINAKVGESHSLFSKGDNPHMTHEAAAEVLNDIAKGTKWVVRDVGPRWYTTESAYGNHDRELTGDGINIRISFSVKRDVE